MYGLRKLAAAILSVLISGPSVAQPPHPDESLIGLWPLAIDGRDDSGNGLHATAEHVNYNAVPLSQGVVSASFDGRNSSLNVPDHDLIELGQRDFTVAAWVFADEIGDDVSGDIVSQYDPAANRGFHLSLKTNAGVTFSQPNSCQLQFGIDHNRSDDQWIDCGRPGSALLAFSMCAYDGALYVGTCEPGRSEAGHVYRFVGKNHWIDCGSPDKSNAVTALATFKGRLFAATGRYRVAGSSLPESENTSPGGRVFRYDGNTRWVDCGSLPNTEAVGGLAVFRNELYATSLYQPAGFFRYRGGVTWEGCALPQPTVNVPGNSNTMRVEAVAPFNGSLYATSYDAGHVFRFDGRHWEDCGQLGENTQTYSLAIYGGQLYVGTWPSGRVYRFDAPQQWHDCGRLGNELEVMGMLVHNGRLIAGTLPLAEVYEYGEGATWNNLARLDHTPDVRYRRAWCMAEYCGRVYCSTLPSGHIYSWRAGRVAMADCEWTPGWHHVLALRASDCLRLFIDGRQVAVESGLQPADFDLSCRKPLQIGNGPNDNFYGRLREVRLYRRALTAAEIAALARR